MSQAIEVKVPDIGDFKDIPVIEVLVKVGDVVEQEQSLVTLESDKATMDVPSSSAGTVKEVKVKVGDNVSEGTLIVVLESGASAPAKTDAPAKQEAPAGTTTQSQPAQAAQASSGGGSVEVKVPDIGDFTDIPVIEIGVKVGDKVEKEQSLVTLESDKATMDVPSPAAGTVKELKVKLGDTVSEGTLILILEGGESSPAASAPKQEAPKQEAPKPVEAPPDAPAKPAPAPAQPSALAQAPAIPAGDGTRTSSHASPSVRKFARELGVDVTRVRGSGPKGRITQGDITAFVKGVMSGQGAAPAAVAAPAGGGGDLNLLPWPKIDFTKFGPVDPKPLSRIKKISGANLHRNWVMIPHVTNNDEADITELEALRVKLNKENEKSGIKITMLAFVIKAVVSALKKFPTFNASLDGDNLVFKKYFHVGFAADTPNGLVVPVIRDADKKGLMDIAKEMTDLSKLAREGKLKPDQMQGGCFSISSLGGIGGTNFTPIINAPEVAILGLSRGAMKPVWDGKQFVPRLTLPLSLSYDHRVVDGAEAARFNAYLAGILADFRRVIL
ncbi:dihydrolipoyllysine-residue acetyltransferase [Caballeronia sp. LP006]|uniref:dihydrolipoyllysine-residue acetyltransferase n=1 Tax=unclassified Caballeronia TaxID=2646786 RepID=UPI0020276F97|nr:MULTISPECIES: dihydrolipoyllysine-residue acetyltransferase [unclassified Caballeronia]MDR5771190.1 dihydrolipoyllysine-residue acetyltransferase [Caballeronia sp. LZ002]MDR5801555.1 dihydrolipoyllysine-residue acetyltransferase [Caballeronia sp. LZ001]MDR5830884.1 dihydrolipoyllysine-residue acetyltransferase [Caballeronia sp. LP006]MDR5846627.1 dihydrolipoyllysine-residue acetyltransferase [Caballeronia sp. LZ003]